MSSVIGLILYYSEVWPPWGRSLLREIIVICAKPYVQSECNVPAPAYIVEDDFRRTGQFYSFPMIRHALRYNLPHIL